MLGTRNSLKLYWSPIVFTGLQKQVNHQWSSETDYRQMRTVFRALFFNAVMTCAVCSITVTVVKSVFVMSTKILSNSLKWKTFSEAFCHTISKGMLGTSVLSFLNTKPACPDQHKSTCLAAPKQPTPSPSIIWISESSAYWICSWTFNKRRSSVQLTSLHRLQCHKLVIFCRI